MTKASDNVFPRFLISEGGSTATPAAGNVTVYAKVDGLLYSKDDAGAETLMSSGTGSLTDHTHAATGSGATGGGATLSPVTLNLPATAAPAQTADGEVKWDSDDNVIAVGDGAATKQFGYLGTTNPSNLGTAGPGTSKEVARIDHVHNDPGGGTFTGQPLFVQPPVPLTLWTNGTNSSADFGWAVPIIIPGAMKVRAMWMDFTAAAAGTYQWGLFDYSSNPAACTKLAGGNAAPGGTGWKAIAADSAPVDVAAGAYMLIWKAPAANVSTIRTIIMASSVAFPWNQLWTPTYTWDDTPDITSASWVVNSTMATIALEGDIDGSGNRWG